MLASIQKIISVDPIDGADRIEKVKVLGWDCVVRKGEFKPGDLCVYIEIDTIIPKYLLSNNPEDTEVIRLKTVKMKGQISQGLVLPLSSVAEESWSKELIYKFGYDDADLLIYEGRDVTEGLCIKKYEKEMPASLSGLAKGSFPTFISKTDEERIQSQLKLLTKLQGRAYYITTKIDGTSGTFYKLNGELSVCSRNLSLKPGGNVYWQVAEIYNLTNIPEGFCIQGEIAGPGIQQNKPGLVNLTLFIFNVFDITNSRYLSLDELLEFCTQFNLTTVPVLERGSNFSYTLEKLIDTANNLNYENGTCAEGIVVRNIDKSISFKVVSNKFLLKYGE